MTDSYSLPMHPSMPNLFPDGFQFPLKETPPEILDIIMRDFPHREYRITTTPGSDLYPTYIHLYHASGTRFGVGDVQWGLSGCLTFKPSETTFSYRPHWRVGVSKGSFMCPLGTVSAVWKSPTDYVIKSSYFLITSGLSRNERKVMFTKRKLKKGVKYTLSLSSRLLPTSYWQARIPVVSTRPQGIYTVYNIPVTPETELRELSPQFEFPIPKEIPKVFDIMDLLSNTSPSAVEIAMLAGVFPTQREVRGNTYQLWSK